MRIVCVIMPYQYELSVFYAHQIHVFHCDFSHKLICESWLVFGFETQSDVSDRLFYLRIKHTLVVETVRYFTDIAQQYTIGSDDFSIVFAHHVADAAAKGFSFLYLANHSSLLSDDLYSFIIAFSFSSNSISIFLVRLIPT